MMVDSNDEPSTRIFPCEGDQKEGHVALRPTGNSDASPQLLSGHSVTAI